MKPNKGLLDQLQQLDPENLGQLDQKQLDQLRENMKEQAAKCQQCEGGGQGQGQGGNGESDWLDDLLNEGQDGNPGNPGGGQPQDGGKGQGGGGTQRGPGTAPGVLGQASDDVSSGELTGLQSEDLSKSLPGDLLQLNDTEHEVDRTRIGPRAGGGVDNEGKGGDRIWKDSLLPAEKKALREFFK
jgi:hypothetical protein